jgi:hypothetical protein
MPLALVTVTVVEPDEPVTPVVTPELPAYVSLLSIAFTAEHNPESKLHPAFDKVHAFTRVFSGTNFTVPETVLAFATERVTVVPVTVTTLVPAPNPVPSAVIPGAIPDALPTVTLVEPDVPVPVVETAVAPAKMIDDPTVPELAADRFTKTLVTVAPAPIPFPATAIPAEIPATLATEILVCPVNPVAFTLIVEPPPVKVTTSEKPIAFAAERFTWKGPDTAAPTPIPLPYAVIPL